MTGVVRVPYDEFGLFHENALEFGLPYDEPPSVRRMTVALPAERHLSALLWGDGDPALVLLHGGGQNAHTWDTVALALRPTPLVAIDLPGHGHSSDPGRDEDEIGGPRRAADDVAVAIGALAPNARAIVGMSFGGLTAIALTSCVPQLVPKVVLVDVLPGFDPARARHVTEFLDGPATFPDFDTLLARTMEFNPSRSESSLRRGILHNAVQLDDGTWMWRHARWRRADVRPRPGDAVRRETRHDGLAEALSRIEVPVMLARGMRPDSVLRDGDEVELRRRLPGATVIRFANAGHSIQGDMPVELAAALADFIR